MDGGDGWMDYDKKCRSEGGGLIDVVLLGYHDTVGEGQECHSNRLSHYHSTVGIGYVTTSGPRQKMVTV